MTHGYMLAVMPRRPRRQDKPLAIHPLRQWRQRYRVTQEQLAAACGVTQEMISRIEGWRRTPAGDTLEALRRETGLPTDAFVRPEPFLTEQPNFLDHYPRPAH